MLLRLHRSDPRALAEYWRNYTATAPLAAGPEQWPWLLCISLGLSNVAVLLLRLLQLMHRGTALSPRALLLGFLPRLGTSSLLLLAPLTLRFNAGRHEVCTHTQGAGGGLHSLLSFFAALCTVQLAMLLIELPPAVLKGCMRRAIDTLRRMAWWSSRRYGLGIRPRSNKDASPALVPAGTPNSTSAEMA